MKNKIDEIMEQVQVFASCYALIGTRFDSGELLNQSEDEKQKLRNMIKNSLNENNEQCEILQAKNKTLQIYIDAANYKLNVFNKLLELK